MPKPYRLYLPELLKLVALWFHFRSGMSLGQKQECQIRRISPELAPQQSATKKSISIRIQLKHVASTTDCMLTA